jgi:hypothetical protein
MFSLLGLTAMIFLICSRSFLVLVIRVAKLPRQFFFQWIEFLAKISHFLANLKAEDPTKLQFQL